MIHGFIRPRLVRLGKIHLGERAVSQSSGKEYPKDLDHFRVPPEVAEVYGETPQSLDIRVPSADIEQWFPYALKRYSKDGKLWCRGDGQVARCFDEASGEWAERPCLYKECPYYADKKCTEIGTLQFILPHVDLRGVYQIATGSWHAINNVYQEFGTFLDIMRAAIGPIADQAILHVTFQLTRELATLEYVDEKDGKRKSRDKWLLHLRPPRLNLDDLEELRRQCTTPVSGFLTPGAETGGADVYDGDQSGANDDAPIDGEIVPEPDETMPDDLYPGATPTGPDMGKRTAFVALLERASELGKNVAAVEKSVVQSIAKDAKVFADLAGDDEADRATEALTKMVQTWDKEAAPKSAPAQPAPTQAPASPAQTAEPAAEGSLDF